MFEFSLILYASRAEQYLQMNDSNNIQGFAAHVWNKSRLRIHLAVNHNSIYDVYFLASGSQVFTFH